MGHRWAKACQEEPTRSGCRAFRLEADFAEAATAGVGAARVAATLALVEAVGPLRLGLTVAATPSVSKWARQYAAVRRAEGFLMARWEQASAAIAGFFGRGGGKGQ